MNSMFEETVSITMGLECLQRSFGDDTRIGGFGVLLVHGTVV